MALKIIMHHLEYTCKKGMVIISCVYATIYNYVYTQIICIIVVLKVLILSTLLLFECPDEAVVTEKLIDH